MEDELFTEDTYNVLEKEYAKALENKIAARALFSFRPPFVLKKHDIINRALELIDELKILIKKL